MSGGTSAMVGVSTALLCSGALAACGSGNSPTHASFVRHDCGTPSATTPAATTRHYVVLAMVERSQAMYTPAQVKAKHPKAGEVMLSGGSMGAGATGMAAAKSTRHLEVKICSRRTGRVVSGHPKISLQDLSMSKAAARAVPAAAMKGIGESGRDLHYGNNVPIVAGHDYALAVRIGGERAVVRMRLRHGMPPVRIR